MSAENDAKLAKALQRAGWVEPPPAPVSPFDGLRNGLRGAGMAGNPIASMGTIFNKPGFGRGVMDPLPDNSVPGFAKPARAALRAKPGDWRSAIADGLDTTMDVFRETGEAAMDAFDGLPTPLKGPAAVLAGGASAPFAPAAGAIAFGAPIAEGLLRDPVRQVSEFSGYAPLSRARDAFADMDTPDVAYNLGRAVRGAGEGAVGIATIGGNAYGAGSMASSAFKGLRAPPPPPAQPVPEVIARTRDWAFKNMPPMSDDWAGMRGQFDDALAGADGVNPDLARAYFQDNIERARDVGMTAGPGDAMGRRAASAGVRAAEADALRKPNLWDGLDTESPLTPTPRVAPQRQPLQGGEPDAYTPFDFTPDEQAAVDLSRQYQGRTGIFDGLTLSPAPRRAAPNFSPEQKAAMNAELERLANEAEVAGQAGDAGTVARAHEDIASIMARTGKPLETTPRIQEIQDRIDAISKELLTAKGVEREEDLLAEVDDLMNERRQLRGKAPRAPTVLGSNGANLFADDGPSIFEGLGNLFSRNKAVSANAEPTFSAMEPTEALGRGIPRARDPNTADLMSFDSGASGPELPPASSVFDGLSAPKNTAYPQEIERIAQSIEDAHKAVQSQKGMRLSDYIRKNGGIADDRGDVMSLIGDVRGRPGLISANGRTLDDLALKAWEDGYFPGASDRPSINELIDALGEDLHGRAIMPESVRDAADSLDYYDTVERVNTGLRGPALRNHLMEKYDFGDAAPRAGTDMPEANAMQFEDLPPGWDDEFVDPFGPNPNVLGSNGGNAFEGLADAASRTKILQDFNAGKLSTSEAMATAGYKSRGALYKAASKVKTHGAVREGGHPEGIGATIDKDAVANEARAILDEYGYIPRDYVTQIAGRLGMNRNSVGRAIFNMKMAKDVRVKGLPDWNDESNLMAAPPGKAARNIVGASIGIGLPYLQYKATESFQNANDPFAGLDQPGM
jgi:hypothetical protein